MKDRERREYYPLFLRLAGSKCLVIGGGKVALRKAGSLLECGAAVEVVSSHLCEGLSAMAKSGQIKAILREFREGDLEGVRIAIAATDDHQTNVRIFEEASRRGILVNVVDDPAHSDFIVPSCLSQGDTTIAISTGGKSPAAARSMRQRLERELAIRLAPLVEIAGEVRSDLKSRGITLSGEEWEYLLEQVTSSGLLESGQTEQARHLLARELETVTGPQTGLVLAGVNYSTMPVDLREKVSMACMMRGAGADAGETEAGYIVLSTCNRTEVYSVASSIEVARASAISKLSSETRLIEAELMCSLYTKEGPDAAEHLFRVASGLDSMILGEYEVLGQVRQALEQAEVQHVSVPLIEVFRHAVRVGRLVRDKTSISKNALSVSSVAVDLACRTVGDLTKCRMLVIGAGEAGQLVAKAAREKGARDIAVTSRSQDRASSLAASLGAKSVPLISLPEELLKVDIVVTCTGAPHIILDRGLMGDIMKFRPDKPLAIIDIAVPRDVDTQVGELENVSLFNIDDLQVLSEANRKLRESEVGQAEAIVGEEMVRFASWWKTLGVRHTIGDLVKRAESIREAQLSLTLKKIKHLSNEEKDSLEAMSKSMMHKILQEPIARLKQDQGYAPIVRDVFGLDGDGPCARSE